MRTSALLLLLMVNSVSADEPVNDEFFEKRVRPILIANCVECHGPKKDKGGLRLDTKAGFLAGGDTGKLVKGTDPDKSLLVQVIRFDGDIKMPLKKKMSDADIATLTAWVKGGAPWPNDPDPNPKSKGPEFDLEARAKALWSFQRIKRPAVPELRNPKAEVRNDIDRFLLAKLSDNGLSFSPPAEKRTLLRRVYFDLIGLPPTAEELDAFVNDKAPDAFEKVVEKLLASPHYGERWGRHWLDLVRYAETHGHEFDYDIFEAWRYRDYVVRAFNADVPYNQFLTEHLAGDLLAQPRRGKNNINESLIATGFWWLGEAKHSPVDSRAEHADRIDNQIDVFGKTVLGLTISCARCHDHKFDPIATKDYYSLFSVLASSRLNRADAADPAPTLKLLDELKATRAELDKLLAKKAEPRGADAPPLANGWRTKAVVFEKFDNGWRGRWDASGLGLRAEADLVPFPHSGQEVRKLPGAIRSPSFNIEKPYIAIRVAGKDGRARLVLNGLQLIQSPIYGGLAQPLNHGDELKWLVFDVRMWKGQSAYIELLDDGPGYVAISEAWFADNPPPAEPGVKVPLPELPASDKPEAKALIEKIRALEAKIPDAQRALTIRDGNAINEHVFIRGSHKTLGIPAPRAFLTAFSNQPFAGSGSGRLELAKAVTDPANPLVARVIVNRLWKHHFGEGLVRSPDDFGNQGQPPTHPELLDWLASELVSPTKHPGVDTPGSPWSLKHMHRLMVLSAAYRQSSKPTAEQAAKAVTADPQNKLLHHQNVRRLEAEAIRDSLLLVSGRLDRTPEGPGVMPHLTEHQVGRGRPNTSGPLDGNGRRSIYLAVRRNFLNPMFTAFDYPTPFTCIGKRTVSNVPAQALVMMNNTFVLQQAELWAKRVLAMPNRTTEQRITAMFEAAFGRPPTKAELTEITEFFAKQTTKADDPKAWTDLAHVLVNAKEFIFIE